MKKNIILFLSIICILNVSAQKSFEKIGNQYWTNTNLNVTTFKNGDLIEQISDNNKWYNAGYNRIPAWCYYNNDPTTESKYGKLYNVWAILDPRGLAPEGFRIPTKSDWEKLITETGGLENTSNYKSKDGWKDGKNGTNSTGMSFFPSGYRLFTGEFSTAGYYFKFFTSTVEESPFRVITLNIINSNNKLSFDKDVCYTGCSIRLVSDYLPAQTSTNSAAMDRFYNTTSNNSSIVTNTSNSNIDSPCNVKSVNIDDIESCNSCRGTGQVTRQSSSVCPNCENWNSEYRRKVACHVCKDTRKNPNIKTWKETCTECKGNGRDYEQEKRNRDFGGYDQRIIKGIYNGTLGNAFEYKSISIEHREKYYGIQTEFDYSKWSTGCSCLGSEWSLPKRGELVLIMNDLQSNGVIGDGQYATNETEIVGDFKSNHIWVIAFGQSILPATKMLSTDNRSNDNYWQLRCKVICIKRK
jgi:uncharacterized protein (TIGR02145 family)